MGCRAFALLALHGWVLVAPLVFRVPRVLSCGPGCFVCPWAAARPRAVRAASFARRVVSKPGQAPPPPTGTAARPSGPSGALRTSGAGCAGVWLGVSSRSPARPCRPRIGLQSGEACGCERPTLVRPPARRGGLTAFGAAPRSPPVPSGPSGALRTGGPGCWRVAWRVVVKPGQASPAARTVVCPTAITQVSCPSLACPIAESTRNFARNSLMASSNP